MSTEKRDEIRIVFVSDVHVGSNYAVFPPDFRNPETGATIEQNAWQRQLFRDYERLTEKLAPADILIYLGDLIEGPQSKEKFETLTLGNIAHQVDAFVHLHNLTWAGKAKEIYVIRGTDYHVATIGLHAEELIARMIGARKPDAYKYSAHDIMLEVAGKRIHAAHHVGVSQVPHYRFTPLAREMWLAKLFDDYFGKVDLIARGHVHYHVLARIEDFMTAFTCPAWQLPTPYQRKRTVFGSNASIGFVEVTITPEDIDVCAELLHNYRPRSLKSEVV